MARSRWKLVYFSKKIWRLIFKLKEKRFNIKKKLSFWTQSRQSSIPLCLRKSKVKIYKGNSWRSLIIDLNHTAYKFGEYAFTRKLYYYPLKKKKRR